MESIRSPAPVVCGTAKPSKAQLQEWSERKRYVAIMGACYFNVRSTEHELQVRLRSALASRLGDAIPSLLEVALQIQRNMQHIIEVRRVEEAQIFGCSSYYNGEPSAFL